MWLFITFSLSQIINVRCYESIFYFRIAIRSDNVFTNLRCKSLADFAIHPRDDEKWEERNSLVVRHCSWLIMSICSLLAQGFSSPSNWSTLYAHRRAQILIHALYDGQGSRWVGQGVIRSSLLPIWSLKLSPFIVLSIIVSLLRIMWERRHYSFPICRNS